MVSEEKPSRAPKAAKAVHEAVRILLAVAVTPDQGSGLVSTDRDRLLRISNDLMSLTKSMETS